MNPVGASSGDARHAQQTQQSNPGHRSGKQNGKKWMAWEDWNKLSQAEKDQIIADRKNKHSTSISARSGTPSSNSSSSSVPDSNYQCALQLLEVLVQAVESPTSDTQQVQVNQTVTTEGNTANTPAPTLRNIMR